MFESSLLRLSNIEVENLFNLYNHSMRHNLKERVTILHGPNGIGKTVVLRMISALLRGELTYLRDIPFSRFSLGFDNGACLTLTDQKTDEDESRTVQLALKSIDDGIDAAITLTWSLNEAANAARNAPFLEKVRHSPSLWRDNRDGELLADHEVIYRFGSDTQRWSGSGRRRRRSTEETDVGEQGASWSNIQLFQQRTSAHLIEAQRSLRVEPEGSPEYGFRPSRASRQAFETVLSYASDYQRQLAETMAQYGRKSQALDQSFPARLISAHDALDEELLRKKMDCLDQKRSDLEALGILDETPAQPSGVGSLSSVEQTDLRVMTLYVQDTEKKLSALDGFSQRTKLLVENINRKFLNKQIGISRERGLIAKSTGNELLALEALSSGEQHELVLLYDLLFRVRQNTIVLIDEPELSLHVTWQKQFLPELLKIVETANFDAVVATHSPFIVGDRADLMVGLGGD